MGTFFAHSSASSSKRTREVEAAQDLLRLRERAVGDLALAALTRTGWPRPPAAQPLRDDRLAGVARLFAELHDAWSIVLSGATAPGVSCQ